MGLENIDEKHFELFLNKLCRIVILDGEQLTFTGTPKIYNKDIILFIDKYNKAQQYPSNWVEKIKEL